MLALGPEQLQAAMGSACSGLWGAVGDRAGIPDGSGAGLGTASCCLLCGSGSYWSVPGGVFLGEPWC